MLSRLRLFVDGEEIGDKAASVAYLILHRIFRLLTGQVLQQEIEKLGRTELEIENLLPHIPPDKCSCQWILDLEAILFEALESIIIKSYFRVHMITLIQDNSLHRPRKIQFSKAYIVILLSITEHKVADHMQVILLIVDADIDFGFSKSILASWINELLDLKLGQSVIVCVCSFGLKGVDATVFKPLIAPFLELELLTHAGVVLGIIGFLKRVDKISELSIGPLVLLEINVEGLLHSLQSKHFMRLLQE